MSAVFKEVVLGWDGEEYHITPDMRLLNRIEQDISLSRLAYRMSTGDVPMSQLATVIAVMLNSAGAKADDAEVYQMLMTGEAGTWQPLSCRQCFRSQKKAIPRKSKASRRSNLR